MEQLCKAKLCKLPPDGGQTHLDGGATNVGGVVVGAGWVVVFPIRRIQRRGGRISSLTAFPIEVFKHSSPLGQRLLCPQPGGKG